MSAAAGYDYHEDGYYDDYGNWVDYSEQQPRAVYLDPKIPFGNIHDNEGRLIDPRIKVSSTEGSEDITVFTSVWHDPIIAPAISGNDASKLIWPDLPFTVKLVKLDVYKCDAPEVQQATTDVLLSRRIRQLNGYRYQFSVFFLNEPISFTKKLHIETAGPPRRDKFTFDGKVNNRDLTVWIRKESLNAYITAERIPGCAPVCADFCDSPDRYFISLKDTADMGFRRMYRFGGYPTTQYYVLESRVVQDCLEAEGGAGMTYIIEYGPSCYAKKGWKISSSFLAFDYQLTGSNLYTVYMRNDPFPRMMIVLGVIDRPDEWEVKCTFYALDVPVYGTCTMQVHHCIRSIYSTAASVSRHRLTNQNTQQPWEFRFQLYVFPIYLADCTFNTD